MVDFNSTSFHPATFQLTGFPGQEAARHWISIPFWVVYITAMVGNCTVLCIIWADRRLHQPMYLFLCMLSVNDLGMSLSTLPTVLSIFCFDVTDVAFDACLAQMFFIHSFSFMESGILLAMSFDRFVAICDPLRYAAILTNPRIVRIGLALVIKSTSMTFPFPFLIKRLPICKGNVLSHAYCLHPDMMRLACADTTVNNIYGLFAILFTYGLDSVFIILSYVKILRTVFNIASHEQRLTALNTCASHICAVLLFYIPIIAISVIHRFGGNAPRLVHILTSYAYLFVPPVLNPFVYSMKTKEIRKGISRIFARDLL
ncbi:olfactory receptor 51I1-like [Mauremys reevesii]|uniref:olfactory receptor 51I1-like n=1 Tax=Mauremys reevesii TaxID=260615 RepID=UPI00193FDF69|nr:olfactory receptor 51I1-like [Mauremys reevesii]XP_039363374.1 olfactory receptor 51I1-like [Mauremys reevesii]